MYGQRLVKPLVKTVLDFTESIIVRLLLLLPGMFGLDQALLGRLQLCRHRFVELIQLNVLGAKSVNVANIVGYFLGHVDGICGITTSI